MISGKSVVLPLLTHNREFCPRMAPHIVGLLRKQVYDIEFRLYKNCNGICGLSHDYLKYSVIGAHMYVRQIPKSCLNCIHENRFITKILPLMSIARRYLTQELLVYYIFMKWIYRILLKQQPNEIVTSVLTTFRTKSFLQGRYIHVSAFSSEYNSDWYIVLYLYNIPDAALNVKNAFSIHW